MSAEETKARILLVTRRLFCHGGFDQTGVRDIAAAARVDPAIVMRLFGTKESLFTAIADGAFSLEAPFDGPTATLGLRIAQLLTGTGKHTNTSGFDEFRFLLHSAASPTAAPILSQALHAGFVKPLARHLGGRDAVARATLLTACVLGFATMREAIGAPALKEPSKALVERLAAALQACLGV